MKVLTRICNLLMALLLAVHLVMPAQASGSVSYDGVANTFVFAPGSKHSLTNLFGNYQHVMPGDILTDQILIRNDSSKKVKIKVYLRSLGAQENTDGFLSQMKLTVQQADNSILFAAPADETAQLTDWNYLGTIYSGGEIPLNLTLEIPVTMGNEYQNAVGFIDWEFKVEELPIEPTDPKPPKTSDTSDIFLYSGLMVASLSALILLFAGNRRKRKKTA